MKKHLSALLVLLMSGSILLSCGETAPATSGGQAADTAGETAAEAEETAEPSYLDGFSGLDFGGAELKIIALSVPGQNPSISLEDNTGERVFDQQYMRDRETEDLLNITLSYTDVESEVGKRTDQADKLQKAVMAGDCPWNFMINSIGYGIGLISSSGVLADMTSLPYFSPTQPWWSANINSNMSYKGKIFFDGGPISLAYYYSPCILAYNQRLAESFGLGDVYQIVEDGLWTIDRFDVMAEGVASDIDGNGKMNEDDQFGLATDELSAQSFFIGIGGRFDMGVDNVPTIVVGSESNMEKLQKAADVIGKKERTLNTEKLTGASYTEKKTRTFKAGRSLFLGYNMSGLIDQLRDMEDDYGIIPLPKADESQEKYLTYGSCFGPVGVCVPMTNAPETNEIVGAALEAMAYLSYTEVQPLMYEITLKEKVSRDERSKDMLDIIYADIIYDWTSSIDPGGLNTMARAVILGSKKDPVSSYAKIEAKAAAAMQAVIDAYESNM